MRADSLWKRRLGGRRIDFLKIDVDANWRHIGLGALVTGRAFAVLVIEIDTSWGAARLWGVTEADRLAWLASRYGYHSYLKASPY
jgi:hypothetical protein